MGRQRRANEAGHRPKFLAVVDGTPECGRALRFAARRAGRTNAGVILLCLIAPPEGEIWLGVGDLMQAEAEAEAEAQLASAAAQVRQAAGLESECLIRTGDKPTELLKLIETDDDIAILVLAAGMGRDGPGPLVTALAGKTVGSFPIPVAIVPGHLSDGDIDALA